MSARYTLAELQALPTLSTGHTDNLKIQTADRKVWLARIGVEDGMAYDHAVTVERLIAGVWTTTETYPAACACVPGASRCPEADGLWVAANAVYYSKGYDAWQKALEPYNEHMAGVGA